MKASDLRINNWVGWNGPDHYENVLVSTITENEIVFRCGDSGLIEELEPISLTEEWLLKFGFVNDDDDWLISIDDRIAIHVNLKKQRTLLESYDGILTLKNIEYVHQVQNLYFGLTGKELKN